MRRAMPRAARSSLATTLTVVAATALLTLLLPAPTSMVLRHRAGPVVPEAAAAEPPVPGPADAESMVLAARRTARVARHELGTCGARRSCLWIALGRAQMGGRTLSRFAGGLAGEASGRCAAVLREVATLAGILSDAASAARDPGIGPRTAPLARRVARTAATLERVADGRLRRHALHVCLPGADGPQG